MSLADYILCTIFVYLYILDNMLILLILHIVCVGQHLLVVSVNLAVEGGEGGGDELSSEIISEDDEQLRI